MSGRVGKARGPGFEDRCKVGGTAEGESFAVLWQSVAAELFQRCLVWTGGRRAEAEEAFGRASLQIFVKYQDARTEIRNPRAWMLRIARNFCIDVFRESRRRREEILEDGVEGATSRSGSQRPPDPERLLLGKELHAFLLGSIDELPVRLRDTVRSHLDLADRRCTADQLALSEVNLRKRLQLARDQLRERLASYRAGQARLPISGSASHPSVPVTPWLGRVEALRWLTPPPGKGVARDHLLALRFSPVPATPARTRALEGYVQDHPAGWVRRLDLARERLLAGRVTEAISELERVVERQPHRLGPWLELAEAHTLHAGTEAGRRVCTRARVRVSGEGPRLFLRGLEACWAGCLDEAARAWRAATTAGPPTAAPWIALARLHEESGRLGEVVEALAAALAIDPEDQSALCSGHASLRLAGHRFEARRRDERALDLDGDNPVALVRWLCAQTGAGSERSDLAAARRRRLELLAEREPAARRGLTTVDRAAGGPYFAGPWLSGLGIETTEEPAGNLALALHLERRGRLAEAWHICRRARANEVRGRTLELLTCRLAARLGKPEVVTSFRALLRDGASWDALSTVAWAIALLGNPGGRARELSLQALELQPRLAAAWIEHGRILAHGGLHSEARDAFEQAWNLLPTGDGWDLGAPLALDLCRLYGLLGERAAAALWHGRALAAADALRPLEPVRAERVLRAARELRGATRSIDDPGTFLREPLLVAAIEDAE